MGPEVIPEIIGSEDSKLSDGIGIGGQPRGAWAFESGMQNMLVTGFDEPGADR